MSKSLIQTANSSQQTVAVDGIISLGSTLRRFGCNCRLNGNAIELKGEDYYAIDADIVATPTATGNVTVTLFKDGVAIPGATATVTVGTAGNTVTLPINTTVRVSCCGSDSSITAVLIAGAGTVNNISMRVIKQ